MLQYQQNKLIAHKHYLTSKINSDKDLIIALSLLLPASFIGWKLARGKWVGNALKQIVEIAVLAVTAQFKQQIVNAIKKAL